jgi:hypothetical protein
LVTRHKINSIINIVRESENYSKDEQQNFNIFFAPSRLAYLVLKDGVLATKVRVFCGVLMEFWHILGQFRQNLVYFD